MQWKAAILSLGYLHKFDTCHMSNAPITGAFVSLIHDRAKHSLDQLGNTFEFTGERLAVLTSCSPEHTMITELKRTRFRIAKSRNIIDVGRCGTNVYTEKNRLSILQP